MKRLTIKRRPPRLLISGGVFIGVIVICGLVWRGTGGTESTLGGNIAYWGIASILAISLSLLTHNSLAQRAKTLAFDLGQTTDLAERESLKRRLEGMVQLNQLLIDAQNEEELIDSALKIISNVVGSDGASFIPFDEWGQPLNTFIYGAYPIPALEAWSDHLNSHAVRQRCQVCNDLHSDLENGCPLLKAPFTDVMRIYCLPMNRNNRRVGIVNLYLRADQEITTEVQKYLQQMLNEMALAIEITRLRNQELVALRQLQLADNLQEELSSIVAKLVDGLREVLDFKHSRAIFRSAEPGFSGFEFMTGNDPWLSSEEASDMIRQRMQIGAANDSSIKTQPHLNSTGLLLLPFCLPEGTVIGAVIMTGAPLFELQPRQTRLIETVTTQAALLVENERRRLETEYRTIIQERVRLAREIHDSLAQTLAYLKLSAAQMQSQLAQGDLTRLAQNLSQSHEALSDAYLETRQAIDNLRFAPQQNMASWLELIAHNFEQSNGLKTQLTIPERLPRIRPEVQAQLVRIIQEAFSNIRKHSQASNAWINVREWNNSLIFDIGDDGIGFSAEDVPDIDRHGLRGMRERAELIGAEFQIYSQAARGTTIHIEVPVNIQETTA